MNFDNLILDIEQTHSILQKNTISLININLTVRNWLIGYYIVEFEQNGNDRATYGEHLLEKLAEKLKHIKGLSHRNLKTFKSFYLVYPQIASLFSKNDFEYANYLKSIFSDKNKNLLPIGQTLSAQLNDNLLPIKHSLTAQLQESNKKIYVPIDKIVTKIPFSNLVEILRIEDSLKRAFYEIECMKANWSVRTLKRQISTLLYERTAMSKDKNKMIEIANQNNDNYNISDIIRNPYMFEFIGLKETDIITETELETALLNHIQQFLLELGEGFCFEARQKRIPFEKTYGVVDLVFYHRILKCHVLIELKVKEFDYSAITQLNTYVSYYRKNVMKQDDKPTIGILLCTEKDNLMVEYALAGLDEKIFVSEYLLFIPSKEVLEKFIKSEIEKF